jgi:hypothetical protein
MIILSVIEHYTDEMLEGIIEGIVKVFNWYAENQPV